MLGNLITRILVLALGYAYPAFECFKTIEKNKVDIQELRFWCQYWIIVAMMTIFERFGDIFISWLPFYGEMKVALFIYLWYPKIKGSGFVYESVLKPLISKHEKEIDRNLEEVRARAWDLFIFHAKNCTQLGQTTLFQFLHYLSSHTGKLHQKVEGGEIPSAPTSPERSEIYKMKKQPSEKWRPPLPPPSPTFSNRSAARLTKSESVQIHLHEQTKFLTTNDASETDQVFGSNTCPEQHDELHAAHLKLRRTRSNHSFKPQMHYKM